MDPQTAIKLWIFGGAAGILMAVVAWGAVHLIRAVENGIREMNMKITFMNETIVGFIGSQVVLNKKFDEDVDRVEKDLKEIKIKVEKFHEIGQLITKGVV